MDNENSQISVDNYPPDVSNATIEVPVPANNPNLYRYEVTDELLRFLIDRPFEEYTLRKLASLLNRAHRGVGMAVNVLEENDVLIVSTEGNKKLIQINRDRISTPEEPTLRIPQRDFHEPIQKVKEELIEGLEDVLGIEVYGSVARGEADRQSDIDLWVLVRNNRGRNQARAQDIAKQLSNEQFGNDRYDFHIVVESPDSVPTYTEEIAEIVRSGITIYGTQDFNKFRSLMEGMIDER